MEGFIVRYYRPLLSGLIVILMVLSFLLGREEGRAQKDSNVILSCSPEVLSALAIPATQLATEESAIDANKEPSVSLETAALPSEPTVLSESASSPKGRFLGSKNGTKYYTPDCAGAKRIKPENYVWFIDEEDAKIQGYAPAKC